MCKYTVKDFYRGFDITIKLTDDNKYMFYLLYNRDSIYPDYKNRNGFTDIDDLITDAVNIIDYNKL